MNRRQRGSWKGSTAYLLRETALILGFSYFILAGGTLNGVMRFRLRLISQGLLTLVFVAWLLARAQKGEKLARASFDTAVLAFLGIQILAALLSTDPRRSLAFCGQWIAYALWFYLLRDLLRHGWPAELVVKSLLIVSGILVGLGLAGVGAQWIKWASTGDYALPLPLLQRRFYSLLGDPNMTADLLNLLWPLALARLASTRARSAKGLLSLWLAAVLFTQLLTQSQGGLAGLVASTLATLLLLLLAARPPWFVRGRTWFRRHRLAWWGLGLSAAGLAGGFMGILLVGGDLAASRGELWTAAWQTFLRSPLWGSGPFTFGTQYLLHASVPPRPAYPHAHNYWLNTAAETGLLGLTASIWVAVALGVALLRRWRGASLPHRILMAGAVGSLTGFATHSLADNHIVLPGIGLIVIAVLALALSGDETPTARVQIRYRLSVAWLGPPALILALGSFLSGRAYWHYEQGRQLAESDLWADAVPSLERATRLDPYLAFYRFQSGFAHSVLAAETPESDHLTAAIEAYERGIALEPNYSLNHANLGSLYGAAGRLEEAIAELERAVQLAPAANLYHLNLGRLYEAADRVGEAAIEYDRFLNTAPDLSAAYYWRQTSFRQRFVQGWQSAPKPDPPQTPRTAAEFTAQGWQAYDAGRYEAALEAFQASFAQDSKRSDTAHGLAVTHMALGSYEQSDFYFGLANVFLVRSNRPDPLLDWGRLAYRQGEIETAIARYEAGLSLVEEYSIYGPGTLGWSPYANFLFQRESIARELAPQLIRIDVTDDLAQRYLELGRWYEELGDPESAAAVYRRVLARVPDLAEAGQRLHALTGDSP